MPAIIVVGLVGAPAKGQQKPASLTANVSIETPKPQPMLAPGIFFPGETLTFSVDGTVVPFRVSREDRECAEKFIVCIRHHYVWKIAREDRREADGFPVLVQVVDSRGTSVAPERVNPKPVTQSDLTNLPEAMVRLGRSTTIELLASDKPTAQELVLGRSFKAFLGDKQGGDAPNTQRVLCRGHSTTPCGTGAYTIRLLSVDVSVRRSKVIDILSGPTLVSPSNVVAMIDFWLTNEVRDGEFAAREAPELRPLSVAILKQYRTHHSGNLSAEDMLRLAVKLDEANTEARSELVSLLVKNGRHAVAIPMLKESLPGHREEFAAAVDTPAGSSVLASAFYSYASDLVSLGEVTSSRVVDTQSVEASASYYREAATVLGKLRARGPTDIDWGTVTPTAARSLYLSALKNHATVAQLLRTASSLQSAERALLEAMTLVNREIDPAALIGVNADSSLLALFAPVEPAIAPLPERSGVVRLDVLLRPRWADRVVGSAERTLFLSRGKEAVSWTPGDVRPTTIFERPDIERIWSAAGRQLGVTGANLWVGPDSKRLDAEAAAFSPIGELYVVEQGKLTRVMPDATAEALADGLPAKATHLAVADGDHYWILSDDGQLTHGTIGISGSMRTNKLASAWSGRSDLDAIVPLIGGQAAILLPDRVCVAKVSAGVECAEHGIAALPSRVARPGLVAGSDGLGILLRPKDAKGPAEFIGVALRADGTLAIAAPVAVPGIAGDAYAASRPGVALAVDVIAARARGRLRLVSASNGESTYTGDEISFSPGTAALVHDGAFWIVDAGTATTASGQQLIGVGENLGLDRQGALLDPQRDANGRFTGVRIATLGKTATQTISFDKPVEGAAIDLKVADHLAVRDWLVFGHETDSLITGAAFTGVVFRTADQTVTDISFDLPNKARLIAVWPRAGRSTYAVIAMADRLAVIDKSGAELASLMTPTFDPSAADWEGFAGSAGLVVRGIGPGGAYVARFDDSKVPIVASARDFDVTAWRSWIKSAWGPQIAASRQAPGYVNADTGLIAVPGATCLLLGQLGTPLPMAPKLPSSIPLNAALVANGNELRASVAEGLEFLAYIGGVAGEAIGATCPPAKAAF